LIDRVITAFADWFVSKAGLIEVFIITAVIVIAERVHPSMDPNGFWLLYWLTVWSGFTQNLLAYVSTLATRRLDEMLQHMEQMQSDNKRLLQNQNDMLKAILILAEREAEIEKAHNAHVAATKHRKD
jgi:hypothetical protein